MNRRIGHTVRLVRLLDTASQGRKLDPRVFLLRRVSGHLRLDGNLWTFIYFPDPYVDIDEAHFASYVPGDVQGPLASWADSYVGEDSHESFIDDLSHDGFGFVVRILREIKTSWKLFLHDMEVFLEDLV